jgi:hypothetical protein
MLALLSIVALFGLLAGGLLGCAAVRAQCLVTEALLHSSADASPPAALLVPYIPPVCAVLAPCGRGASALSVLTILR